jgi:hypothetical protein
VCVCECVNVYQTCGDCTVLIVVCVGLVVGIGHWCVCERERERLRERWHRGEGERRIEIAG